MKHLHAFFSLTIILAIASISAMLYLNKQYVLSAVLTTVWVVAITRWIAQRKWGDQVASYLKSHYKEMWQATTNFVSHALLRARDFFLKDIVE
ncbi:MAG: hypothetical protein JST47_12730 [Bacteroidetes bacterium]|nr:hypothetical protein [Bacteroidota bacterium]